MHRIAIALVAVLPVFAGTPLPRVESVVTQTVEFAPGGTIHIAGSTGELNVEGWDRNSVEITVTRYAFGRDEEKAKRELERVQVAKASVSGSELTLSTAHKHAAGVHVDYRIRAPRDSRLVIRHGTGDIVVFDMAGDIDATARAGGIVLQLPANQEYSIDAKNKMGGDINSEFAGTMHHVRPIFGERLDAESGRAARRVRVRVGVGGIDIQRIAPAISL